MSASILLLLLLSVRSPLEVTSVIMFHNYLTFNKTSPIYGMIYKDKDRLLSSAAKGRYLSCETVLLLNVS